MIIPSFLRPRIDELFFRSKAEHLVSRVRKFLSPEDKIIDLGAGIGLISMLFKNDQFDITPVDVQNKSLYKSVCPILYDGKKLPFPDDSFDACFLLAVLHHTQDPEEILNEAKRVARKAIILEDIYSNRAQKGFTYLMDSLLNMEFFSHPRSNRTDNEWSKTFQRLGFTLKKSEYFRSFLWLSHAIYYLERE